MPVFVTARRRVHPALALAVCAGLWIGGASQLLAQSTPTTATLKEWDIFAATGGGGSASQNVAAILMDVSGIAGPAGNVWLTLQNPLPRLGRLDPSAATNNYLEWRPVSSSQAGGPPLGIALNKSNADVWISMQGDPSFLMKLGGTNTFRSFRSSYPLVPHGLAVAADHAAIAALPVRNGAGIGNAIARVPRNPTSGAVTVTLWNVGGEPRHVALDNSGNIWFTARATNKLARLNPSNGVVTEWALPSGSNPSGVQGAGNTVCVASEGGMGDRTGVEHCLTVSTNQITTYVRVPGEGFDLPQQTAVNSDAETFVTEQNGNSISFIAFAARAGSPVVTVTPTTRTVLPKSTSLVVADATSTPTTRTVAPTQSTLTGVDAGGNVRFTLPPVALTYPFALTGYPQPVSITPVFNDQGRGTGVVFFGQYFDGPILGRTPAARLGRLELVAAPALAIITNPQTLRFDAVVGSVAPGAQAVEVSEASGLALSWTAAKTASWLSLAPASGAAPSSMSVTANHASLAAGSYTDTITVDDGPGNAGPKQIAVTLNVTAQAVIAVSPTSLSFAVTAGGAPSPAQTLQITNTGSGTLDWTASSSQPWLLLRQTAGTAPSNVDVLVDPSVMSGGTQTGIISISSLAATNSPVTVAVTATVSNSGPQITLGPASMTFSATVGGANPSSQALTITNSGGGTLAWSAGSTAAWLSVSPASGTAVAGAASAAAVEVSAAGLARGSFSGSITVTDVNASNSPQTLPVMLTVTAPVITLNPSSVTVTAVRTDANPANQTVTVSNTGDATLNYTATVVAGGSWLSIASGASAAVVPGTGNSVVLAFNTASLAKGVHTGTVQIADPNAGNSPQTVTVTLTVTAPIIGLSPTALTYSVLRGRNPGSQTLTVSNTGDAPLNFSAAATTTTGGAWLAVSPATGIVAAGGSTTLTAAVTSSALASGPYGGTISITDGTATNSPQAASVSLTVLAAPTIALSPSALNVSATKGGANPSNQSVAINNTGDATLSYSASVTSGAWLSIAAGATGSVVAGGSGSLALAINISSLAKGTYTGTVQVVDANAPNTPQTITVTLTVTAPTIGLPTSLSFTTLRTRDPATQTITVNNTGDASLNFSAAATTASGGAWLAVSPASGTVAPGATATLTATVTSSALASGSYSGSISVNDANASNNPQATSVALTVNPAPTIALTPASLTFTTLRGRNPATQTITVNNSGDGALNFTAASSGGAWLAVSPASGTVAANGSATLTVTIASSALVSGSYSGAISVADANATNPPQTTSVGLTVTPAPTIDLAPASLAFTTLRGRNPATQAITVTNTGDAVLAFAAATSGGAWLSVAPATATLAAGASTTLTVTIASSALASGSYSGEVSVSDANATNTPHSASVALTVQGAPSIALTPAALTFTAPRGTNPATQTITVNNSGDAPLSFAAATTGGTWLSVSPATGIVGAGLSTTLTVTVTSSEFAPGSFSGSVTVTDPNATNSPQTTAISLTVQTAPTIGLTPTALTFTTLRGRDPAPQTITVSNTGDAALNFSATTAGGAWLSVAPATGTVAVGATATLTVTVTSNALASGSFSATVSVTDPNASNTPQSTSVALTVNPAPTIALGSTSLSFTTLRGRNPSTQTLVLTNSGDAAMSFTAAASTVSGGAWLAVSPASGTVAAGGTATLTATVTSSTLGTGSYSGSISVSDANASNNPQAASVALTVTPAPTIALTPTSLTFTTLRGRNPATQTITVNNTGDGALNFTATPSGGAWLAVSPASGTVAANGSATLTVTIASSAMASGSFSGSIAVADPNATNTPQATAVALTVTPAPTIGLSATSLSFSAARLTTCNGVVGGANPANQTVSLSNSGDGSLGYTISSNAAWLTLSPASGTIAAGGAATTLTVSVNLTGLAIGTYTGTLTITDANATNSPQTITVTLTVTAAAVRLCVVPTTLALGNIARNTTVTGTVSISNVGDGTASWTRAFTAPANHTVTVTPTTGGNAATTVTISVKPSNTAAVGGRTMTVTFTSGTSTDTLTVTWTVT